MPAGKRAGFGGQRRPPQRPRDEVQTQQRRRTEVFEDSDNILRGYKWPTW